MSNYSYLINECSFVKSTIVDFQTWILFKSTNSFITGLSRWIRALEGMIRSIESQCKSIPSREHCSDEEEDENIPLPSSPITDDVGNVLNIFLNHIAFATYCLERSFGRNEERKKEKVGRERRHENMVMRFKRQGNGFFCDVSEVIYYII